MNVVVLEAMETPLQSKAAIPVNAMDMAIKTVAFVMPKMVSASAKTIPTDLNATFVTKTITATHVTVGNVFSNAKVVEYLNQQENMASVRINRIKVHGEEPRCANVFGWCRQSRQLPNPIQLYKWNLSGQVWA